MAYGIRAATITFATLAFVLAAATQANACACCTNAGQRNVGMSKIDAYAAGVLDTVRFGANAQLYTGEADIGDIKGIKAASDRWTMVVAKTSKTWRLAFDDGKGNTGNVVFVLPASITKFEVDTRAPEPARSNGEPLLYKEWRLTTKAEGAGMFAGTTGHAQQATLILHGRGNSCTDASQFTAWSLVLHGAKGTSTVFGTLQPQ